MTMRTLLIAIALSHAAVRAGAQQVPRCSSENNEAYLLPRIAADPQVHPASAAPTTATRPTANVLVDNDTCTRLRHAVRDVVTEKAMGINLRKATWTFFDLGDVYAVLLSPWVDPKAEVIMHGPSTLLVFSRDVQPRYLTLSYY